MRARLRSLRADLAAWLAEAWLANWRAARMTPEEAAAEIRAVEARCLARKAAGR